MSIIGELIIVVSNLFDILLTLYTYIVIAAALVSWVSPSPYNPIVRFLYSVTEPLLAPIRRIIPWRLPIDISPLILILAIYLIQRFLITSLLELGYRIKGGIA